MRAESIDYLRRRERAEREAARAASCEAARRAHETMANAYARLAEIEELESAGAIPAGRVVGIAAAMREREMAEERRRAASLGRPVASPQRGA